MHQVIILLPTLMKHIWHLPAKHLFTTQAYTYVELNTRGIEDIVTIYSIQHVLGCKDYPKIYHI